MAVYGGRSKKPPNIAATGKDEAIFVTPPRIHSIEATRGRIEDDEFLEMTSQSLRRRNKILNASFGKRGRGGPRTPRVQSCEGETRIGAPLRLRSGCVVDQCGQEVTPFLARPRGMPLGPDPGLPPVGR